MISSSDVPIELIQTGGVDRAKALNLAVSNFLDMQFWLSITLLIVIAFSRNDKKIMSGV